MKRAAALLVSLVLLFSAAACGQQEPSARYLPAVLPPAQLPTPEPDPPPEDPVPPEPEPEPEPEPPWEWETGLPDSQGLRGDQLPTIHEAFDGFPLLASVIVKNGYIL